MKKILSVFLINTVLVTGFAVSQTGGEVFPVKRVESPETWRSEGQAVVTRALGRRYKRKKAKNIILFVGDGMGISTMTAARILEGQLRGESGEENLLSFERFPFSALSRTYSVNQQTSDSAPTMSAIITGLKTSEGVISVNQNTKFNDYASSIGNEAETLVELAEKNGRSTGVVSTARLTHATPAACYAHAANRGWEDDASVARISPEAHRADAPDIARQLIEFKHGNGLEVALGGGRQNFLPEDVKDPEYPERSGMRQDGRNLPAEWTKNRPRSPFVWNKEQFDAIDSDATDHLLGLFEPSHMRYEYDRGKDAGGEPSLTEMTSKAIDILNRNKKGYVLVVEAGRIDHAHHNGNAFRALTDTIELSNAVRAARAKVDLDDTMIVVTADHSHGFTIGGYPVRGNNILGLVREVGPQGDPKESPALAQDKKPYTTLRYSDGPGFIKGERPDLDPEQVTGPEYRQQAAIPTAFESHSGEDVAIFADGVNAWMFAGSMEQNWIYFIMRDALRL